MADSEKAVNVDDICVWGACCCFMSGCYMNWPGCCGCSHKVEYCCIVEECCCKCGTQPYACGTPEGMLCRFGLCCYAIGCKKPTTCCKEQDQCFTLVNQCAIPTDDEVPCAIAAYGLTCYPIFGCCKKIGDFPKKAAKTVTPM